MPEAADETLGMAIMSAVVLANGSVISKSGVVSVARTDAGKYTVDFVRSVVDCAPVATATPGGSASWFIALDPNYRIDIETYDPDGAFADKYFSIIVFCPQ